MCESLGSPQLVFLLREPVSRAYSSFYQVRGSSGYRGFEATPQGFHALAMLEMEVVKQCGPFDPGDPVADAAASSVYTSCCTSLATAHMGCPTGLGVHVRSSTRTKASASTKATTTCVVASLDRRWRRSASSSRWPSRSTAPPSSPCSGLLRRAQVLRCGCSASLDILIDTRVADPRSSCGRSGTPRSTMGTPALFWGFRARRARRLFRDGRGLSSPHPQSISPTVCGSPTREYPLVLTLVGHFDA